MKHFLEGLASALFYILLNIDSCYGQASYPIFEHLTSGDGLSSDKVEAIIQDRKGFYWIATENGLNRYDGTTFKIFRHHEGDSTSLTNDFCTDLAEDSHGDIWVATIKGISRYISEKGIFQPVYVTHPVRNFEIANRIRSIVVDKDDNVWISGVGFWKYDRRLDSIIFLSPRANDLSSVSGYRSLSRMVYDSLRNGLWLTTDEGINFYDIIAGQFYHMNNNPRQWVLFDRAKSAELCIDHQGKIWFRDIDDRLCSFNPEENNIITTTKQLDVKEKNLFIDPRGKIWLYHWSQIPEIYDPGTGQTDTSFFVKHHQRSILCERIQSVYSDHEGNEWIASNLGISIYNERNQFYKLHQLSLSDNTGSPDSMNILAMCQTAPHQVWVSTDHGFFNYNLQTEKATRIAAVPPAKYVSALCPDGNRLWLGVKNQLYCINATQKSILRKIELPSDIFFIYKGVANKLWVGLWAGGLCEIDINNYTWKNYQAGSTGLKANDLVSGFVDKDVLWIGYNGGYGFSKYDVSSGHFSNFHPNESEKATISSGTITAINRDTDHNLWLGTYGNGIFLFDESKGTYTNFQHDEGLKCNYINCIIPDQKGNLWISTADGINYLQSGTHAISSLDMNMVFRSNGVVSNGMTGIDGHIYFFCYKSFVEIDPAAYQPEQNFPEVVISAFRVLNAELPIPGPNKEISLTSKQNFFSFEYSALKTQPSKLVRYAYMLEGLDKNWNEVGEKTVASYTNVPGGHYHFKLKVTNDKGQWSEALISIPMHVYPPFWLTWWFILIGILAISTLIYFIYQFRIRQIKKIYSLRTKISQDLHDDIGASLSSIHIYSSVAENEITENPEKAKEFLQQINTNSREVMENISDIVWANKTDQKSNSSLSGRIKNYGQDLLAQKNIECQYLIDEEAEKKLTKPESKRNVLMIIKEALNNMAKYSEASDAEVRVRLKNPYLLIEIKDNGKGFDLSRNGHGNGLFHMKKRTDDMGGSMEVQTMPGQGTMIHCKIPLANISD